VCIGASWLFAYLRLSNTLYLFITTYTDKKRNSRTHYPLNKCAGNLVQEVVVKTI